MLILGHAFYYVNIWLWPSSVLHLRSTRFPMASVSLSSFSHPPSVVVPSPCLQFYGRILLPRRTLACSSSTSVSSSSITSSSSISAPKVVVTRERGKNGKLVNALVIISCALSLFSFSIDFVICDDVLFRLLIWLLISRAFLFALFLFACFDSHSG